MYISRYAINGWGVLFLQEAKGFSDSEAISIVSINALLGILGTVLSGWFSDKLCKGDRKHPAPVIRHTEFRRTDIVPVRRYRGVGECAGDGTLRNRHRRADLFPRRSDGRGHRLPQGYRRRIGRRGSSILLRAGIQDVASGWLIDAHITVAADGTKVYDFAPVAFFWIAASVISFLLPLLNWKSNVSDKQAE